MRLLITIYFLTLIVYMAKSENLAALKVGVQAGGAIPNQNIEGSYAIPGLSFHAGIELFKKKTERIEFKSGLNLHYRNLTYGQEVKKDTLISIEIQGQQGKVPSYYYAEAEGEMRFLSLEIPFNFYYIIKEKLFLQFGVWGYYHLYKYDSGTVHIQIGEGGVLDDLEESFDNENYLRQADFGLSGGIGYRFNPKLSMELEIQRGLFSVYKSGFTLPTDAESSFNAYNTYALISLRYKLFSF
ncbi:MAG: hypothetical protein EA412_09550 [Chitinophagaceae bacterium]|nr:MAG: hypothetical protein EA412_09550 [Chitinophagaceae bacterium]